MILQSLNQLYNRLKDADFNGLPHVKYLPKTKP